MVIKSFKSNGSFGGIKQGVLKSSVAVPAIVMQDKPHTFPRNPIKYSPGKSQCSSSDEDLKVQ